MIKSKLISILLFALGCLVITALFIGCDSKGKIENQIQNLRAFTKLYGYIRYFHPSDEAARIDWDTFAMYGAGKVKQAKTRADLKAILEDLFGPIAPTVRLFVEGEEPELPPEISPPNADQLRVIAWQHMGMGTGRAGSIYKSIRLNRENKLLLGSGTAAFNQLLDAAPHSGKEVRLKAYVRAEVHGAGNQAMLSLRVNRESGTVGFSDTMSDRPIRSNVWDEYEITGKVDDDAKSIVLGGIFQGKGKAWFDDFQVDVRAEGEEWTQLSIQNGGFEDGARDKNPKNWATPSQGYFFEVTEEEAHEGNACLRIENKFRVLKKPLFETHPEPGELIREPLERGLFCQIPLALYSDEKGTLGKSDVEALARLESELAAILAANPNAENENLRLGDIIIIWNVFQHFYSYFDQIEVNWDDVLDLSIERAFADKTEKDFFLTMSYIVAQLQDGHGSLYNQDYLNQAGPPFGLEWIEDKLVVIASQEPEKFRKGDIILTIDGEDAVQILKSSEEFISGSPQWKRYKALLRLGFGEINSTVRITLLRNDQLIETEFKRTSKMPHKEHKGPNIQEFDGNIYYVNLDLAPWKEIEARIDDIAAARGVIFDLRGYPNGNDSVISYLLTEKDTSQAWMRIPQILYPDREKISYQDMGWGIPVREPHIQGKVVFLTDGRAISYAESFMSFIEHYKLAEIVGQPTAGANGNINYFDLPGGFRVIYTGMKVVKHDGSQHHTIGILPTIYTERTIKGVQEGRDEFIEKALEIINKEQ